MNFIEMEDVSTNSESSEYIGFCSSFFGLANQLEVIGIVKNVENEIISL